MINAKELHTVINNEIKSLIPNTTEIKNITSDMSLNYDLGLDSISLVSLFHKLGKSLHCELAAALGPKITEIQTIKHLVDHISRLIAVEESVND
jgi:acyl carrier protein